MPSAGRWMTGICSTRASLPGICWNAPARSPAVTSPIPYTRTSLISRGLVFRSAKSARMEVSSSPRLMAPVALTAQTCKEQLLYEVHDPARYIQPDVVADFSQIEIEELAKDRVRISGGRGSARPPTFKVSVGYVDSFIGEGQISYAGPGALARGRLALDIVRERLELTGVATSELRFDLIGVDSLHGAQVSGHANDPYEVRVRVTGRTENLREAVRIGNEVETLYTNGPAGGGGAFKSARDVVAVASVLLPRELAAPQVQFVGGT